MSLLPKNIVQLDAEGKPLPENRWFRREDTFGEGRARSEQDWDVIICANAEALADSLREAGVIAWDSTLRVLGTQVDAVDVLLAEVPMPPDGHAAEAVGPPRRLVLVEDKLVTNSEAKRQVLAQIVDYAQQAQESWTARYLANHSKVAAPPGWLERYASDVDVMLGEGDLLLVVAGNDISDDLLRLAKRFAAGRGPLSQNELCLVSLAIYRRGEEQLLVPHVVSAVERAQRTLNIRVQVKGAAGEPLPARVTGSTEEDGLRSGGRRRWDEASFLADLERTSPESLGVAQKLIGFMKELAGTERAKIQWGTGNVTGSLVLKWLTQDRPTCSLFGIGTDGQIGVFYGDLDEKLPAQRYARVITRIAEVPGFRNLESRTEENGLWLGQSVVAYRLATALGAPDALGAFQQAIRDIVS